MQSKEEKKRKEIAKTTDTVIAWTVKTIRKEMDIWEDRGYVITRKGIENILDAILKA